MGFASLTSWMLPYKSLALWEHQRLLCISKVLSSTREEIDSSDRRPCGSHFQGSLWLQAEQRAAQFAWDLLIHAHTSSFFQWDACSRCSFWSFHSTYSSFSRWFGSETESAASDTRSQSSIVHHSRRIAWLILILKIWRNQHCWVDHYWDEIPKIAWSFQAL